MLHRHTYKYQPFLQQICELPEESNAVGLHLAPVRSTTALSVSPTVAGRDVPKFGLGRTSAEGFGSVWFGHASTFGRTSVLFGLCFALGSAHFIAFIQSLLPRISIIRHFNKLTFTFTEQSQSLRPNIRPKFGLNRTLVHL